MIRRLLLGLVCRWRGHRERKLRFDEPCPIAMDHTAPAFDDFDAHRARVRICTFCGATRLAKARGRKAA